MRMRHTQADSAILRAASSFALKQTGVDDISEQGINLHARVFGSGWKSDMQLRMNSGGHGETLDAHDAMFVCTVSAEVQPSAVVVAIVVAGGDGGGWVRVR